MKDDKFTFVLEKIINNFRMNGTKNYIVGISGIDCSGKSTFANRVYNMLIENNIPSIVIHGDDFLFDRRTRNNNPRQDIGYYYETFDYEKLFNELLKPLQSNLRLKKELFLLDWMKDTYNNVTYIIDQPSVILVEGVFLFRKELADIFNLKIWLQLSFEDGIERVRNRSRDQEYYGDTEEIHKRYTERFYKGQKIHLKLDSPISNSDLVIESII